MQNRPSNPENASAQRLIKAYQQLNADAAENPLLNPVRRLASDLFQQLERGALSVDDLSGVLDEITAASFEDRAAAFFARRRTDSEVSGAVDDLLARCSFEELKAFSEHARTGVVFTAHPTFALGAGRREHIAAFPSSGDEATRSAWRDALSTIPSADPEEISLRYEHDQARSAINNAQDAISALTREILLAAEQRFPDQWTSLDPNPVSLATWVGYDLDGRTDIHWGETIRIRLEEKAAQLNRYTAALKKITAAYPDDELTALGDSLAVAAAFAEQQTAAFSIDLFDPEMVVQAANLLTASHPGRLVSLDPIIDALTSKISASKDTEKQRALMVLRAEMRSCGLGVARIHLRVNAAQVRSALRADLGLDPDGGFLDRSALDIAAKKATETKQRDVNFGSVFQEQMTARRQLMLCAQILKHIDADTPIRFLIAECEAPATVMGAVYLARLYGVERKIDISPLFETAQAIESGGRFIERLLKEYGYRDYVIGRGCVSIQIGFSDSGRFMGQCAAGLAVERLQVLFARAMSAAKLPGVDALIFNTHGESMGRGAHSGNFTERLNHLATPWVRSRFEKENIPLKTEYSFQGGEGFLHFQTAALSAKTIDMLWSSATAIQPADTDDRFYADINFSWDFYRNLRSWQEALFGFEDYHRVLSTFPDGLLFKTGSRKAKRPQGDSGRPDLSAIRAIPHNALLQQLAIPVNISGGIGMAAGREAERLVDHIAGSPRMRELIALAAHARDLTDVSVLRAYAGFYAPSYWATLTMQEAPARADAYEAVQQALGDGETAMAFQRLADFLTKDLRRFDAINTDQSLGQSELSNPGRDRLLVLHALRQALIAHGISLVASAPSFSRRHDVDHGDLVELALALKLQEAIDLLSKIFPKQNHTGGVFAGLNEKIAEGDAEGGAYPEVHAEIIEPLKNICAQFQKISLAVSNHYGAFG